MSDEEYGFDNETPDPEMLYGHDLLELSISQLDELYMGAKTPEISELDGSGTCLWLAGPLSGFLPASINKLRTAIAGSVIFPWKGMALEASFDGGGMNGSNLLFSKDSGLRAFNFEVSVGTTAFDEEECVVFDYNVDGAFPLFKSLRDEVRKLKDGLFLGRGNVVIAGEPRFIAYFSLEMD